MEMSEIWPDLGHRILLRFDESTACAGPLAWCGLVAAQCRYSESRRLAPRACLQFPIRIPRLASSIRLRVYNPPSPSLHPSESPMAFHLRPVTNHSPSPSSSSASTTTAAERSPPPKNHLSSRRPLSPSSLRGDALSSLSIMPLISPRRQPHPRHRPRTAKVPRTAHRSRAHGPLPACAPRQLPRDATRPNQRLFPAAGACLFRPGRQGNRPRPRRNRRATPICRRRTTTPQGKKQRTLCTQRPPRVLATAPSTSAPPLPHPPIIARGALSSSQATPPISHDSGTHAITCHLPWFSPWTATSAPSQSPYVSITSGRDDFTYTTSRSTRDKNGVSGSGRLPR